MIIKESKLFSILDRYIDQYSVIKEEDEDDSTPFPEENLDELEEISPDEDQTEDQIIDPTETPTEGEIPPNEEGNFISGPKLAMFATTLMKAYQTQPKGTIPNELLAITSNNANEVISYIQGQLELDQPTNDISDDLSKI